MAIKKRTGTDPDELSRATDTWHGFTRLIKYSSYVIAFFLIVLAVSTL